MEVVKDCLLSVFARFGIAKTVVSDNGPEFVALKNWLRHSGCWKLETTAYAPSANGAAERAVQTVKRALKGYSARMGSFNRYLFRILFNHRTASGGCKRSPAEKLLGRPLRTAVNPFFEIAVRCSTRITA